MVRSPPRLEHCLAVKQSLPNFLAHHGPATAYAEPAGAAFEINLFSDANDRCQELAAGAMQNELDVVALASPVRGFMHASGYLSRSICATMRLPPTSHRIFINACPRRKESQQQLWLSCLACMKTCQGVQRFEHCIAMQQLYRCTTLREVHRQASLHTGVDLAAMACTKLCQSDLCRRC